MRPLFAAVLALIVAGCGGGGHHQAAPAPAPFADVAGTYLATVTSASGVYASVPIGTEIEITVSGDGAATTPAAAYALVRNPDGSVSTSPHLVGAASGVDYTEEIAHAAAHASTLTFNATEHEWGGAWQSVSAGTEVLALVRQTSG